MLRERLHFQASGHASDGWRDDVPGAGDFETKFTVWASLRPRVGGEAVTAARLDGRQPYVVLVRNQPMMEDVTVAWRLVDENNPDRVLNVISPPADPDGTRQWLEFLAEDSGRPS